MFDHVILGDAGSDFEGGDDEHDQGRKNDKDYVALFHVSKIRKILFLG